MNADRKVFKLRTALIGAPSAMTLNYGPGPIITMRSKEDVPFSHPVMLLSKARILLTNMEPETLSNETALAPTTLSHPDTTFVLHHAPDVVPQDDALDIPLSLSDSLDNIIYQDFPVSKLTWASTDVKGTVILSSYPIRDFINTPSVRDRISNRKGMKATFNVTIKINAPGACKGALLVEAYPKAFANPRVQYYNAHENVLPYQQEIKAVFDPSDPSDITLTLPPHHVEPYMELYNKGGGHWRLDITVRAPIESVISTLAAQASIRVYVSARKDAQFIGLIPEMISGVMNNLSKNISEKGKPILGKATAFAASATKAAGDLADLFGYTKLVNQETTMVATANSRVFTVDSPDPVEPLALFAARKVDPIPSELAIDPLSFDYICGHEALIHQATLADGGKIIIPVCIGNFPGTNTFGPAGRINTPAMYCALPFQRYRADTFIFNFRIFSSPQVRGDIYIYYMPYVDIGATLTDAWEVNTKKIVVSLQGSSCTEVAVHWNANSYTLPTSPVLDLAPSDPVLPDNGMLVISVGKIYSPKGAVSLDMDVTLRVENLQVLGLADDKPDLAQPFSDTTVTCVTVTESGPASLTVCSKHVINQKSTFDVSQHLSGAPIRSLRALAQRPSVATDAYISQDGYDANSKDPGSFEFYRFFFPKNGLFPTSYTTSTSNKSGRADYMTYAAYSTLCFVGYRGSTRHSVVSDGCIWRVTESGVGTNFIYHKPNPVLEIANDAYGSFASPGSINEQNFWAAYRTISPDVASRVQFPYDQNLAYFPSCWAKVFEIDIDWDLNSVKPWTAVSFQNAFTSPLKQSASCNVYGGYDFRIYSSVADDFSVFMWRGVPALG